MDILRGPHSTGIAAIGMQGNWTVAKKKGTAWDLFDSKCYEDAMRPVSYALIGHNRYATKGKINNVNAHPFEFEDVVGCHNGTIRAQWRLPDSTHFEVDSENIFYAIQNEGLETTLGLLDGAYALSYWDKRSSELILLRNDERELSYCYSEDGSAVFWASEQWMLHVALSRNNIKYGKMHDVTPCYIHRFTFPLKYEKDAQVGCSLQAFKEFRPPQPKTNTTYHGGNSGQSKKLEDKSGGAGGKPSKVGHLFKTQIQFIIDGVGRSQVGQEYLSGTVLEEEGVEVRLYPLAGSETWRDLLAMKDDTILEGYVCNTVEHAGYVTVSYASVIVVEDEDENEEDMCLGYGNKLLTDQQFLAKTEKGCAWCASPVGLSQAGHITWIDSDSFVCQDCAEQDEVKEHLGG